MRELTTLYFQYIFNFKNLAAVKVIPALLTPGINARIWNNPINIMDFISKFVCIF